jgi:glycosyltransferase involved in cell wall biosynthesis
MVFDNASCDETAAVVSEMASSDPRVEYYCHERNIGMHANFNHAFSRVSTPFFGILTDDDYYLPSFLEDAMRAFEVLPSSQLSILSAPMVTEDGVFLADQLAAWPREGGYAAGESIVTAAGGSHPIFTTCIFRRPLQDEMRFDPAMDSMADVPILISVLARYPFHLSKKRGGLFFKHASSYGANFAQATNAKALCTAYLKIEAHFQNDSSIDAQTLSTIKFGLRRRIDKLLFSLMLENITLDQPETVKFLRQVIAGRSLSHRLLPAVCLSWASTFIDSMILANSVGIVRKMIRSLRGVMHAK